jgi:Ca2+:H+ antiporter
MEALHRTTAPMDRHHRNNFGTTDVLRYGLLAKRMSRRHLRVDASLSLSQRGTQLPDPSRSSIASIGSEASERTPLTKTYSTGGGGSMMEGEVPEELLTDTEKCFDAAGGGVSGDISSSFYHSTRLGKEEEKESIGDVLKDIVLGKLVSVLLLFAPLAFLSHYLHWDDSYNFWFNFFTMIPLAAILGDFTEEVALHTNQTIGGLVNATFGNAVEVVVAIQALLANEIRVVQASMLGSIFSNLLLVLGCCFFFGGLYYKEQEFNSTAATANMGLLALSSIALVLPTPFAEYYNVQDEHVLAISRMAAIFLMAMYLQLLVFQLHTHAYLFDESPPESNDSTTVTARVANGLTADSAAASEDEQTIADAEAVAEEPRIPMWVAIAGLLLATLGVTIFSDFLVASIDGYCSTSGVSRSFVGLIIIPIVGNAVEHITAVTVAMKDKMDLAMGGTKKKDVLRLYLCVCVF